MNHEGKIVLQAPKLKLVGKRNLIVYRIFSALRAFFISVILPESDVANFKCLKTKIVKMRNSTFILILNCAAGDNQVSVVERAPDSLPASSSTVSTAASRAVASGAAGLPSAAQQRGGAGLRTPHNTRATGTVKTQHLFNELCGQLTYQKSAMCCQKLTNSSRQFQNLFFPAAHAFERELRKDQECLADK